MCSGCFARVPCSVSSPVQSSRGRASSSGAGDARDYGDCGNSPRKIPCGVGDDVVYTVCTDNGGLRGKCVDCVPLYDGCDCDDDEVSLVSALDANDHRHGFPRCCTTSGNVEASADDDGDGVPLKNGGGDVAVA